MGSSERHSPSEDARTEIHQSLVPEASPNATSCSPSADSAQRGILDSLATGADSLRGGRGLPRAPTSGEDEQATAPATRTPTVCNRICLLRCGKKRLPESPFGVHIRAPFLATLGRVRRAASLSPMARAMVCGNPLTVVSGFGRALTLLIGRRFDKSQRWLPSPRTEQVLTSN